MSVSSKPGKSLAIGFVALLTVLLTACGSSKSPSNSSPNFSPNSNRNESPSITPPPSPSLELTCSDDLKGAKQEIVDRSKAVINHWLGNIWLNSELSMAILTAERMAENPACEKDAKGVGLPETIAYGKKVQSIGEKRVSDALSRLK
jgi:hypothetical protein